MAGCIACGHEVVAWCPIQSESDSDRVCYNCGLHADSEAAKTIASLRDRLNEFENIGQRLVQAHKRSEVDWNAFRDLEHLLES